MLAITCFDVVSIHMRALSLYSESNTQAVVAHPLSLSTYQIDIFPSYICSAFHSCFLDIHKS